MEQRHILLVDDDTLLLSLYARKFEEEGFAVEKANSADEALEHLRGGLVPDIIVFDMVMPHTDGYDFLAALNNEHLAPAATRIALTNETEPGDKERAEALGVTAYLGKASLIPSEIVAEVMRITTPAA